MTSNGQGFWKQIANSFSKDIGIDLGTANTLVHVAGRGVLLNEPSVVVVSNENGEVIAVGDEAKQMMGRTPGDVTAIRPLRHGVIADYDQTRAMLHRFIGKVSRRPFLRQTVVVGIPSGVTEVEKRAVLEATRQAGATKAYVIEEAMAAAIGAGIPVHEPMGAMVVDIGGGTTEIAVIAMSRIVHSNTLRIAGDELDEAIVGYMRRAFNLAIGERTAEVVKVSIGSAYPLERELSMEVKGRDVKTGMPRSAMVTSEDIRAALSEPIHAIVEGIKITLEATPPELAADCMNNGIVLAGGGALLLGLDKLIAEQTDVDVKLAKNPLTCVVNGTGKVVEAMHDNRRVRKMLERSSRT
jgi:rod shape-determining protein MreB